MLCSNAQESEIRDLLGKVLGVAFAQLKAIKGGKGATIQKLPSAGSLSEEARVKKARDILVSRKGKKKVISSTDLGKQLGITEDDTHVISRRIILKAIRKYKLPVAATNTKPPGYFYIADRSELDEYRASLQSRIWETEDRLRLIIENYVEHYGPLDEEE